MNKTKISAEVVADSLDSRGNRLTSLLITFPRIILAEINTHRMLSKNTSSSRAIPFNKMVEAVQNNPFIPIAWQKHHLGMQGNDYITRDYDIAMAQTRWLRARDEAINNAQILNSEVIGVTKQLCNRLLEPFMWTTMLITGSREGWDNFFKLRCPVYQPVANTTETFKSKRDAEKRFGDLTGVDWFKINKGQAEIHMMALAEAIYDCIQESVPKQLKENQWHVPFIDRFESYSNKEDGSDFDLNDIKISVALAARTSYTIVGEEKEIDYQKMIELHDRLLSQDPPHSSPMEHACQAVTDEEYNNSFKGQEKGWFRNYKGFKSYRQVIEESK